MWTIDFIEEKEGEKHGVATAKWSEGELDEQNFTVTQRIYADEAGMNAFSLYAIKKRDEWKIRNQKSVAISASIKTALDSNDKEVIK